MQTTFQPCSFAKDTKKFAKYSPVNQQLRCDCVSFCCLDTPEDRQYRIVVISAFRVTLYPQKKSLMYKIWNAVIISSCEDSQGRIITSGPELNLYALGWASFLSTVAVALAKSQADPRVCTSWIRGCTWPRALHS